MNRHDAFLLDKRRIAAAFNRAAPAYAAHAVLQNTVAERLAERLEFFRLDPHVVLDIGSGCGNALEFLAHRYPQASIIAVDLAVEMLRVARAGVRFHNISLPSFACGDAEALPIASGSVDFIFSNLALQWCPDLAGALREFRRVLRPEGLLLFTTLGPDTLTELRQSWASVDADVHVHAFIDMHDVGDTLIRAGFSSPVMDVERLCLTYSEVTAVMRDLKVIGAHNVTAGRPSHLTGKGKLRKVIDAYERRRRDGVIPATYEVIYGHAWTPTVGTRAQDGSTVSTFPLSRLARHR